MDLLTELHGVLPGGALDRVWVVVLWVDVGQVVREERVGTSYDVGGRPWELEPALPFAENVLQVAGGPGDRSANEAGQEAAKPAGLFRGEPGLAGSELADQLVDAGAVGTLSGPPDGVVGGRSLSLVPGERSELVLPVRPARETRVKGQIFG
ncbi:hypothetical protein KV100_19010 [Mumia sp. zg.B21]|uniref:hypothetical protein n=1 Tax=Mumia sp. zg.B21 TaxID=2855447 RepID=UPI001C6F39BF|nr:hypothetical protein [Mumia sp. zg.B21]MBW9211744.1 hypothetical protein [Mumia sp. zg.B21]